MEVEKTLETAHGRFLLRPYRDEDEEKVVELWETAFKQKMDRRIWYWKFHDNPFGRQMMLCLNEAGDPIALYSGIPFLANWNGHEIRMTQLIDNMSHPAYRHASSGRKGLFIQTAEYFFEVYGGKHASVFHYGFPGIKHFKLGKIFLNYEMFANGVAYMESELKKPKRPGIIDFGKVERIENFSSSFDKLWEDNKLHYPFAVCRNQTFLTWRFLHHPVNNYQIYTYRAANGNLKCYLVLSIHGDSATIVDIFSGMDEKPLKWLVYRVAGELSASGVNLAKIWIPNDHFILMTLKKMGFVKKQEPLGIIPGGRCFDPGLDFEFTDKNIFYTMADGDLF